MTDQVINALRRAHLALSASHNLTVTDRPDLPRKDWPVWVTDHRAELAAIEEVIAISIDSGLGCADRRTSPSTAREGSR
ncbi:hypothetical protein [Pseudazoarcus pumilus]|uniref:hypothetical protein n=1 Tax=Pseudazoarcus pumilus TaxID=2067960 RepID=UPI0013DB0757|nr:hypothetical protein [Pseudazoarcus pumilus]